MKMNLESYTHPPPPASYSSRSIKKLFS